MAFPVGSIDVVEAAGLQAALGPLGAARELAVDVEADAMHAFRARLCFVQVGTDDQVFVFDTLQPGVQAAAFAPTFGDAAKTKFFHAAGGDLQYLAEAGVRVNGLFDTHRAATLLGWPKVGLADLARDLLQVELPKEHQQSDFSLRPLPPGVHDYIANDVRYLCEIGRRVREACKGLDILEEVELDCERLAEVAAGRPDVGMDFKAKLPRGALTPAQLVLAQAIIAELHPLRLKWAEAANVPMGRMLSNAAVIAIATRRPATVKELSRSEGVRGPFVREHGDEVLQILHRLIEQSRKGELKAPEEDKGARDPQRRKRLEALKGFRAEKAAARKVTPSVILTNPLTEDLAANPPKTVEDLARVKYFGEKRARLYGAELVALLS